MRSRHVAVQHGFAGQEGRRSHDSCQSLHADRDAAALAGRGAHHRQPGPDLGDRRLAGRRRPPRHRPAQINWHHGAGPGYPAPAVAVCAPAACLPAILPPAGAGGRACGASAAVRADLRPAAVGLDPRLGVQGRGGASADAVRGDPVVPHCRHRGSRPGHEGAGACLLVLGPRRAGLWAVCVAGLAHPGRAEAPVRGWRG